MRRARRPGRCCSAWSWPAAGSPWSLALRRRRRRLGAGSAGPRPLAPTPTEPEPGSTEPPSPELAAFYSQELEWARCEGSETLECATVDGAARLRATRAGAPSTSRCCKTRPPTPTQRLGSLAGQPRRPRRARHRLRRPGRARSSATRCSTTSTSSASTRAAPATSSPVDCLSDERPRRLRRRRPGARHRGRARGVRPLGPTTSAPAAPRSPAPSPRTSPPSRPPATWTCSAPRWARRRSTYFGASYGTKLGATYAELFPEKVGRFVLDGARRPLPRQARRLASSRPAASRPRCGRTSRTASTTADPASSATRVDEGLDRISEFLDQVDEEPLPTRRRPRADRRQRLLRDRSRRCTAATTGSCSARRSRQALRRRRRPRCCGWPTSTPRGRPTAATPTTCMEALPAINCLDDPYAITAGAGARPRSRDFEEASPTFGDVFAWGAAGLLRLRGPGEREAPDRARGGGRRRSWSSAPPATPPRRMAGPRAWPTSSSPECWSRRDGDGHTGYNAGNDCVDEAVEAYLVDGTVPEDGLSC